MNLSVDEVQKMKVVELRAELTSRGLDTRGVKAVLVDRLLDAVALEGGANGASIIKPTVHLGEDEGAEDEELSSEVSEVPKGQESPKRATRGQALPESPKKTPGSPVKPPTVVAAPVGSPVKPAVAPQRPAAPVSPLKPAAAPLSPVKPVVVPAPASTPVLTTSPAKPVVPVVNPALSPAKSVVTSPANPVAPPVATSPVKPAVAPTATSPIKPAVAPIATSPVKPAVAPIATSPVKPAVAPIATSPVKPAVTPIATSPVKPAVVTSQVKPTVASPVPVKSDSTATKPIAQGSDGAGTKSQDVNNSAQSNPSQGGPESMEITGADVVGDSLSLSKQEAQPEQMETEVSESLKRKHEENGESEDTTNLKTDNVGAKKLRVEEDYKARVLPDDEPEYDETLVLLDWYKSDLNLKISKEGFLKGEPIVFEDFPWAYAGAKATHGFTSGKLAFEVKWLENSEVKFDFGKVEEKHILRLGWSDLFTDLQLGEEKFSYGYDSQGQFYNGGETADLEEATFEKGDVLTSYLDLESDPIEISFAKNGVAVGSTIQIPKAEIEGKIWFPHILARNTTFEVNFGASEPTHPLLEAYEFVSKTESPEARVRGPARGASKAECDFIMLCGMACCGKTQWSKEYKANNLDKHFNILGTSTVAERALKKTTLGGPDTPKSYDSFLMKAGRFVERLVDMAPARRRNYILDQSNVLPNVQRRKAAGFEGFKRRAVVILPNDEEYQSRIKAREQVQGGKSVPKSTLLDMKATFRLPEVGETFSEVEFPELSKEEADELLKKYNKEGQEAGYGQRNLSVRGGGPYRGGRGGPRPPRGGFFRGGRGGGGGGGWRGGPPPPRGGGGFRGIPRGMGGPPRVLRDVSGRGGGYPGRGPPRGMSRGIPSLIGTRRNDAPRGFGGPRGGGGSWGRGAPSNGFQRGGGGRGGGGYSGPNGFRGNPGGGGGRFNAPGNMGMGVGRPQQHQQSPWASQPQSGGWGRGGGGGSGYGGNQGGGGQYADPWAQQVPDQGYGQSWDNSGAVSRGGGGGGGSGGGTWQGYGGQTYGAYGYGRK